jgi:hypothetical protein
MVDGPGAQAEGAGHRRRFLSRSDTRYPTEHRHAARVAARSPGLHPHRTGPRPHLGTWSPGDAGRAGHPLRVVRSLGPALLSILHLLPERIRERTRDVRDLGGLQHRLGPGIDRIARLHARSRHRFHCTGLLGLGDAGRLWNPLRHDAELRSDLYADFRHVLPIAIVGGSIYVFDLGAQRAAPVR